MSGSADRDGRAERDAEETTNGSADGVSDGPEEIDPAVESESVAESEPVAESETVSESDSPADNRSEGRIDPGPDRESPPDVEKSTKPADAPKTPETETGESVLYRFRHDRDGALMWIREMSASVGVVLLVGLLLFGVSGIWPPMVAVESGSMEPNMQVGDLVFVTEPGRLAPDAADGGVGVVTHETGESVDYRTFGSYGSVVIYTPPGRTGSPIIHRAMFHVTEGENWYDRADERYHNAVDCESLANCPAPHDGYVTLGDDNGAYDQASGLSPPVRAEWVGGVARLRVPYLGYIRLIATGQVELNEAIAQTVGAGVPASEASQAARTVGVGVPASQTVLGASSPAT
ncbi:S26 family signal peptidase [Halobacteriales archaeon SW_8_68_21]|nr:MAG: S26 family signal peptidase [Halobacteriales archaeon SW_8_68_21]